MIFDNDGVFTDGGLYYSNEKEIMRKFNAKDGIGIKILQQTGIKPVIITGKKSIALEKRAEVLQIDLLFEGVRNKMLKLRQLCDKLNVKLEEIIFLGDDLNDLHVLEKVGLPICVKSAPEELKNICSYVTKKDGGNGAVREAIEFILKKENLFEKAKKQFLESLR